MSLNLPDLPHVKSANFLQRVREMLQVLAGKTDRTEDRLLTVGDLVDSGIARVTSGAVSDSVPLIEPTDIFQPAYVPDLSTPPTPTGLSVSAGLTSLVIATDAPAFTAGHGYLRTLVYGARNTGVTPTYTEGVTPLLTEFVGSAGSYPVNPKETWHIWVKWKSVDGVISGVAGGTNGVSATSGQDINGLLTALSSSITTSQLNAALGSRIDLIDAPSGTAGSVNARILQEANDRTTAINNEASARGTAISNEATLRQNGDNGLAQQISLLTAGVAGGFDPGVIWYFDSSVESWTATGATIAANAGWVDVTSTGTDPAFISPAISVAGSTYAVVKARIKRLAGSGWDGTCFYTTSGHGISASYKKTIAVPSPFAVGDTAVVEFDMSALTAGGTDWTSNTITGIRLDLGATSSDVISVDWVGVGRNAPGASMAGLLSEQQARISADTAEANDRLTLTARVDTTESNIATNTSAITQINNVSATSTSANALALNTLKTAVNDPSTGLAKATADIGQINTVSASSTSANAQALYTLRSAVNDPSTGLSKATADISQINNVSSGSTSANAVALNTLRTAVNDPNTGLAKATADIAQLNTVSATSTSATAQSLYTLKARVDNVGGVTMEQKFTAQGDTINGLSGQYTVKVDNNGYVSGFGLASTATTSTPYSIFAVRADKFTINAPVVPGDPLLPSIAPFTVTTNDAYEGGILIPAGVYMDGAYIRNLSAVVARIGNAAIDNAKIASLSAAKLTAGSIATGEYIQSTGYVAGSAGFKIDGLGSAEFNSVTVRGTIYASAGTIGSAEIGTNYVNSTNYAAGSAGWRLEGGGNFYANNASLRGSINGGAMTAYAWPAAGTYGYHLSTSGLLIGNANSGTYFQVDSQGNVYAPSFSIGSGGVTLTNGLIRNSADTARLDLSATGSGILLRAGTSQNFGPYAGTHYPVEIKADGNAFFGRNVVAGGTAKNDGNVIIPMGSRPAIAFLNPTDYSYEPGGA